MRRAIAPEGAIEYARTRRVSLVAAAGEFAVVLGDRVLIAGGNLGWVGVADGAAAGFVELAAQLQFQGVHAADKLLVHLLHQGGIAGETAGIQIAHLIDQRLQLLPRLGTILHRGANLVEKVQSLVDLSLRIGGVGTRLGRHGVAGDVSIAGVVVAVHRGIAIGPASRTGNAVAHGARLASAALSSRLLAAGALAALLTALAALLTALPGLATLLALLPRLAALPRLLTGLAGLPIAAELAWLELLAAGLAATAGLTLSGLL